MSTHADHASPAAPQATGTKRQIIDLLKRRDGLVPGELAEALGISEAGVRQHLGDLADRGLVARATASASGPGRPPTVWSLTDLARDLFPDRHADLTVALIQTIRDELGADGLDRVIDARTRTQRAAYLQAVPAAVDADLPTRLAALARQRSAEGYLAEVVDDPDADAPAGSLLLHEHHCPICDAATTCQSLCRSELDLFREVLGGEVEVERVGHLLSGDRRCTYRVRPKP